MTLFWFDQVTSWIIVGLCWWIVHLTDGLRKSYGIIAVRIGIAALGIVHMVVATLRLRDVQFIAGGFSNAAIIILLVSVIVFHWHRFGRR